MPIYKVTAKVTKQTSGQRIERGMSVQVATNSMANPIITDRPLSLVHLPLSMASTFKPSAHSAQPISMLCG